MSDNFVVITGIGLVSSQGIGVDAHWQSVIQPLAPHLEQEKFAPYTVHSLKEIDWTSQIPKRSDQRQMETWQKLGTYAAGLALEDAGLKNNLSYTANMDMIIAAGGGERDILLDEAILQKARDLQNSPFANPQEKTLALNRMLNHMLTTELRPTLFLAQLTNLLAGNISIVHKITGSSRSFMGEEGSGLAALETAFSRICSGQSSHILIGSAYHAEHSDMLLSHELNSYLNSDGWSPIWSRLDSKNGGLIPGSGAAFLVLETLHHAKMRGAKIYGRLKSIQTDQSNRNKVPLHETLTTMLTAFTHLKHSIIISGASGVPLPTGAEELALQQTGLPYRAFSSLFGYMREAQFLFCVALATLSVYKRRAFNPFEIKEVPYTPPITTALAVTAGVCHSEGVALICHYDKDDK